MRTICVIIEDTVETYKVTNQIEQDFPCWTSYEIVGNGFVEFSIYCRQEDARVIEGRLSKLV